MARRGSSTEGTTGLELAQSIGSRLAKAAVVATVDGREVDLELPLPDGAQVAIVTADSDAGREVLRHSTAHVMAQAVRRLWPGAKYAIGPVIENGFYYDFELPDGAHFSDDDLDRIDAEMRDIIKEDQPFVRHEHTLEEGLEIFADQPFKQEIIEAVGSGRRRGRRRRVRRSAPTATPTPSSTCAGGRTCPRPAGWATSSSCGWRARTGAATRSASSCSASTGRPGSPRRRWPPTCTSSKRPSGATTASSEPSSTSSASPRRSGRAWPSSTRRAAPSAA